MKKVRLLLLLACLLVVGFAHAQTVGDTAPAFTELPKYQEGVIQGTFSSSELAGQIIVYNFFGSY